LEKILRMRLTVSLDGQFGYYALLQLESIWGTPKTQKCRQFVRFLAFKLASQASDVGSIPIARSINLMTQLTLHG